VEKAQEMSYWYLATPYSKYPAGIEEAFKEAARQAALLIRAGIPVYSPIAHTHPVAINGNIDPLDHGIWLPADLPLMKSALGLIVCKMESWEISYGIGKEIEEFQKAGKPVVYMEPGIVPSLAVPVTGGSVCAKAASLVGGDRQKTHGDKVENHGNIARLWNAYLLNKKNYTVGIPLSAHDIAMLMALLKVARTQAGSHNLDDYVDLAGYAGVAAEIAERTNVHRTVGPDADRGPVGEAG
jgi:hypothetical protein